MQPVIWLFLACAFSFCYSYTPKLWPIPTSASYSETSCSVASGFSFEHVAGSPATIYDSVLAEAVNRANNDIAKIMAFGKVDHLSCELKRCSVQSTGLVQSWDSTKESEWYKIVSSGSFCSIVCKSVRGCLHGLTTFTQLLDPLLQFAIPAEVTIEDSPAFVHRGVLIDTGRRFLPVSLILRHIDLMHAVKMNVLHWHIVDDQSFPLELQSLPLLSGKGAYSPKAIYTRADVRAIVDYAANRGIRVIPELDMPGHTESWLKGYPELLGIAKAAIDPTRDANWDFIAALLTEVSDMFACPLFGDRTKIHLGGDETWDGWDTPAMHKWMLEHGMTSKGDLAIFWLNKLLAVSESAGKIDVILWEDFLSDLNGHLPNKPVVWEMWLRSWSNTASFSGGQTIFASSFYLDHLDKDWAHFYNTVLSGSGPNVLGGETCMWGEWVDEANFISRVWPRAAAVAERFWSNPSTSATAATARLAKWTCRQRHWWGYGDVGSIGRVSADGGTWTWNTVKEQWFCAEQQQAAAIEALFSAHGIQRQEN